MNPILPLLYFYFRFYSYLILLCVRFIRIRMVSLVMHFIKLIVRWSSHSFSPGFLSSTMKTHLLNYVGMLPLSHISSITVIISIPKSSKIANYYIAGCIIFGGLGNLFQEHCLLIFLLPSLLK